MITVTKNTLIEPTLRLTPHLNVANFTTGMSNGFNVFSPIMTSHLIDPRSDVVDGLRERGVKALLQHHKIARNLQHVAETVIEPALDKYKDDVVLYTAYLNPASMPILPSTTSKHFTGEAVNIFLRSDKENMFLKAEELLDKIKGQYTHAILHFNGISWLQILTNGPFSFFSGNPKNPIIKSIDHALGQQARGLFPFRGLFKSGWSQESFAPFRRLQRR